MFRPIRTLDPSATDSERVTSKKDMMLLRRISIKDIAMWFDHIHATFLQLYILRTGTIQFWHIKHDLHLLNLGIQSKYNNEIVF